jgi:hypothetical protein
MIHENAPNYTNIGFKPSPIITHETAPLTKKELSRLRKHNIPMFLFDTSNECKYMQSAVIRYKNTNKTNFISYEELQQIYKKQITLYN